MRPEENATLTVYERSREGRRAFTPPATDVPETPLEELLPSDAIRTEAPELPEISEPEIVRHYNNLSKKNFDLDTGFYPLGSCTMRAISSMFESNRPSVFGLVSMRHATSSVAFSRRSPRSTPPSSAVPTFTTS